MSLDEIVSEMVSRRVELLAYIRAIVLDHHIAEDVLQEVFVTATRKQETIVDKAHLSKWMWKTAKYIALNAIRKHARSSVVFDSVTLDLLEQSWAQVHQEEAASLPDLQECVDRLPHKARELIRLRYVEGLKSGEIAKRLGRSAGSVYNALSKAHAILRDCMSARRSSRA